MKKAIKKIASIMFLLALTVTLNAGVIGTIPQNDNGGIAPMNDLEIITEFYI